MAVVHEPIEPGRHMFGKTRLDGDFRVAGSDQECELRRVDNTVCPEEGHGWSAVIPFGMPLPC